MTIEEHLSASRAAHTLYRQIHDESKNSDQSTMKAAIAVALDHREQAEQLDPRHTDPAWSGDRVSSDRLITFYHSVLGAGSV